LASMVAKLFEFELMLHCNPHVKDNIFMSMSVCDDTQDMS